MKGSHLALAALVLAGFNAQAAEDWRFGLQAGVVGATSKSLKNTVDNQVGYNVGGQVTWAWKAGQMFRGRVDYTAFPSHTLQVRGAVTNYDQKNTMTGGSGGVDYLYFWNGSAEGLYLTGGVAFNSWKLEAKYSGTLNGSTSKVKSGVGVAGGLGWQFNRNLGLELRGTLSQWDALSTKDNTATTLGLEASWRF